MKFWVDMDNAPHVPVLKPVITELQRRGHTVEITVRRYGQTVPLLALHGLKGTAIGRHAGKGMMRKRLAFVTRSLSLLAFATGKGFDAAISHGSRSLVPAARLLGLPLICLADYEHTAFPTFMSDWIRLLLVPEVIPIDAFSRKGTPADRIRGYPGLKEDLYVHDSEPDPSFLSDLGIDSSRVVVLVRPPATMAHYAVKESEVVFNQVLEYLCGIDIAQVILLPRTTEQSHELSAVIRERGYRNAVIPKKVYDGPSLIWYSDLVISGGGTMNREAAAMGVRVYSIYQGPLGAVDRHLIATGRLVHVKNMKDLRSIPLVKADKRGPVSRSDAGARLADFIVSRILDAARIGHAPT